MIVTCRRCLVIYDVGTNSSAKQPGWNCERCVPRVKFAAAADAAKRAFYDRQAEFDDLRPAFWSALVFLAEATERWASDEDVIETFKTSYRCLGAPGDFGYGTPCGDALKALYEAYSAFLAARKREAAVVSEEVTE